MKGQDPFPRSASLAVIASLLALAAVPGIARSGDLGVPVELPPPASRWQLSATPYGWLTWLQGDQTVRGRTVELDVDPIDLVEDLDGVPFMGYAEARNGKFAIYGDIVYAPLGLGRDAVRSRRIAAGVSGTLSASLGLDFDQVIAEAGGTYEIAKWQSSVGTTAVDVLAGARYWNQEADLRLSLDATLDIGDLTISRGIAIGRSGSVDWFDPVVGAVVRHNLQPGQDLVLRGDIGGFDAGSQFSWNVLAAYSFEICTNDGVTYSGVLGYRLLDVDYEQGSGRRRYEFDVLQHGPLTGLSVVF